MPRYYFHIRSHGVLERDPEGAEFPSLQDAHDEAVQAAREMLSEKIKSDGLIDRHCFMICTENGTVLQEVPFRSAIRLEYPG